MNMQWRPFMGRRKRELLAWIYAVAPKSLIRRYLRSRGHRWVFIIGSTNSGSTLLQDILSGHPEISGMRGEGQYRTRALVRDENRLFGMQKDDFILTEVDDGNYLRVYYDWYFETKGDRKILLEKTPVNSMRMRWLQHWFSPAQFIVIARSPYGVCEGMARKTGVSIAEAAENWRIVYQTILDSFEYVDSHLMITYDDLTDETDTTLEKIGGFLSLMVPFESLGSRKLKVHEQTSEIKNMDYKSIERLSEEELSMINQKCAEVMRKCGLKVIGDDGEN